ncbi:MAG TPA: toll/interleukin-1 receptor domain-containing protein [Bryobacteraceae bacterium]|jgi:hypothetical protein
MLFISYCSEDSAQANRVCEALERGGVTCWIAPRNIPPGQPWPAAIAEAIRGSSGFVLLLSTHTERSRQISREVELADRAALPILTFRLEEVAPPRALEYFLTNLQWIDGFGARFDAGLLSLAAVLGGKPVKQAHSFEREILESVTQELAGHIGPIARVLVNDEAKRAKTLQQLYEALARELPEGSARKQFLAKLRASGFE